MEYDPKRHAASTRDVVAAWVLCLGLLGLGLGIAAANQEPGFPVAADAKTDVRLADTCEPAAVQLH
jgi:hypothetical protein